MRLILGGVRGRDNTCQSKHGGLWSHVARTGSRSPRLKPGLPFKKQQLILQLYVPIISKDALYIYGFLSLSPIVQDGASQKREGLYRFSSHHHRLFSFFHATMALRSVKGSVCAIVGPLILLWGFGGYLSQMWKKRQRDCLGMKGKDAFSFVDFIFYFVLFLRPRETEKPGSRLACFDR